MSSTQESTSKVWEPSHKFESLAPEILLAIVTQLPELVPLDSLLRVSPSAFRLFNNYGTEITDAILSSGYIHKHIRTMIRVTALIRTSKLPMNYLPEFLNKTTFAAMHERIRHLRKHLWPLHLEANTSPAVLRGILASNRHITNLSLEFIKIHFARFRALKPRRLVDESQCPTELRAPQRLPKDTEMKEYPVQDTGSHSWNEEQRVIRAFWRIQILYDMKKVGANGVLDWSEKDLDTLNKMTVLKFYGVIPVIRMRGETQAHPEYYTMTSVEEYLRETHKIANLSDISNLLWLVPPYPIKEVHREDPPPIPETLLSNSKSRGYTCLIGASTGTWFYCNRCLRIIREEVPFQSFGKWGFAFWGKLRLKGYGLLPEVLNPREVENTAYAYRWLSLLDDGDSLDSTWRWRRLGGHGIQHLGRVFRARFD